MIWTIILRFAIQDISVEGKSVMRMSCDENCEGNSSPHVLV
jgi:hypothetical protein